MSDAIIHHWFTVTFDMDTENTVTLNKDRYE